MGCAGSIQCVPSVSECIEVHPLSSGFCFSMHHNVVLLGHLWTVALVRRQKYETQGKLTVRQPDSQKQETGNKKRRGCVVRERPNATAPHGRTRLACSSTTTAMVGRGGGGDTFSVPFQSASSSSFFFSRVLVQASWRAMSAGHFQRPNLHRRFTSRPLTRDEGMRGDDGSWRLAYARAATVRQFHHDYGVVG